MAIIFAVMRKNIISAFRGEYLDFVVSRIFFALFTVASAAIIFSIFNGGVSRQFSFYTGIQNYMGFIIVGTAMYSYTQSIFLNISRTLMSERREGTLEAILLVPFHRFQYYCGSLLAQLLMVTVDFVILMAAGTALGVSFQFHPIPFALGMLLLLISLLGIAILVSLIMLALRDTYFVQNTILPVILLLGGYLFPPDYLPAPLASLAGYLPLNFGVNLIRNGLLSRPPINFDGLQYLLYLIEAVALIIIGLSLLDYIEKKATEKMLS